MPSALFVNDVHSQLNETRISRRLQPASAEEIVEAVRAAAEVGAALSCCGARHAMGGQQFGRDTWLLDLRRLDAVGPVNVGRGTVEAGAGICWPQLIEDLHRQQAGAGTVLSIRQKQTGADELSLGGALSANIHGRGLRMRPFIDDIEAFTLVDAAGEIRRCSRRENAEWFRLAVGGYGNFGIVTSIELRLAERRKVARAVQVIPLEELMSAFAQRIADGFEYGDFQFAIDERSPDFLRRGVFSCYRPVEDARPIPENYRALQPEDWRRLVHLAHTDRAAAFAAYAGHYLATDGQVYWSDTHQFSVYLENYHADLDRALGATVKGSEMITELYVPRHRLVDFMTTAAGGLRSHGVPVIYGTVRLIERDPESFLAWAREDYACVIFNLHVDHSPPGLDRAQAAFQALIDYALECDGSYYLTYHRWARRDQVARAYPQFEKFLDHKDALDSAGRFQSEWWRHHRGLFRRP